MGMIVSVIANTGKISPACFSMKYARLKKLFSFTALKKLMASETKNTIVPAAVPNNARECLFSAEDLLPFAVIKI